MSDDNYYTCPLFLLVCHIDDTDACDCFHTDEDRQNTPLPYKPLKRLFAPEHE